MKRSMGGDDAEIQEYVEKMPSVEFKNKHGERFTIHSNGVTVLMSGDEVNMMVDKKEKVFDKYMQLFNPAFSIWSAGELRQLGEALAELHKEAK